MLLIPFGNMWMAGTWTGPATTPIAGDSANDINGVAITVGSIVKFVGIVTAVNLNDPHFGDIVVQPLHPNGQMVVPDQFGANPQSPNLPVPNYQTPAGPYGFHPLQLIVGS